MSTDMVVGPLGTGVGVAVGTIGVLVGVLTSVLVLVGVWVKVFVGMGVVLVVPMTYWARGVSWVYAADRYPRVCNRVTIHRNNIDLFSKRICSY